MRVSARPGHCRALREPYSADLGNPDGIGWVQVLRVVYGAHSAWSGHDAWAGVGGFRRSWDRESGRQPGGRGKPWERGSTEPCLGREPAPYSRGSWESWIRVGFRSLVPPLGLAIWSRCVD